MTWVEPYLPLLLAALFSAAAPVIARRLPPPIATWLLSIGGLVAAAGSIAVLGFLAFTLLGRAPLLATQGHWSPTALRRDDPVAVPVEVVALLALAAVTVRVAAVALRRSRALLDAHRLAAALPAHGAELAVIADPIPCAFAVPGRPGRIVASVGLLRTLDTGQRRAVLAHERSHLRHHHHAHHTAAQLAAAANPLLRALPAAVTLSTERWADEDAARTAHRDTVAQALIQAVTTARRGAATPAVVLAVAAEHITARVQALRAPAPRPAPWRIAALLAVLLLTAASTLLAAHDTERLFELAKHAYLIAHH
jgi:Zn-dependent protease with chaperone function